MDLATAQCGYLAETATLYHEPQPAEVTLVT